MIDLVGMIITTVVILVLVSPWVYFFVKMMGF